MIILLKAMLNVCLFMLVFLNECKPRLRSVSCTSTVLSTEAHSNGLRSQRRLQPLSGKLSFSRLRLHSQEGNVPKNSPLFTNTHVESLLSPHGQLQLFNSLIFWCVALKSYSDQLSEWLAAWRLHYRCFETGLSWSYYLQTIEIKGPVHKQQLFFSWS